MNHMKSLLFPLLAMVACALISGCGGQSKGEVASRDNMHRMHSAFMDYSEDNGNAWPASLEDLRPYVDDFDALMTNPITGDNPGYLYTPPPADLDPEENFVMLVQLRNGGPDPSLRSLYSDGTVE